MYEGLIALAIFETAIDATEGVSVINHIYHKWAKTADISEAAVQRMQEMMVGSVSRIGRGIGEALPPNLI